VKGVDANAAVFPHCKSVRCGGMIQRLNPGVADKVIVRFLHLSGIGDDKFHTVEVGQNRADFTDLERIRGAERKCQVTVGELDRQRRHPQFMALGGTGLKQLRL